MKLCQFQPLEFGATELGRSGQQLRPQPRTGIIEGETVHEISGDLFGPEFGQWRESGRSWPLDRVKLLPPASPTKIVCIGRNYRAHAAELGNELPKEPLIFLKPPSSVIGPEEPIVLPRMSCRVDYEGELAVIIGRVCSQLGPADPVRPYIAGYTCLNDVTARDLQIADVQFTRAKGFDTFCPFGPVMETELDYASTTVETYLNGVRKQSAPLTEMIFSVDVIIRWIAQVMTLLPGDVVATGTPAGVGSLGAGDVVEVVVSQIGRLRNPVVASEA
jgi:2-keto-4-pentenoate hydratase/2-oxohepta-3-ene-1,7-dioic acid hydratase in catechol pathway